MNVMRNAQYRHIETHKLAGSLGAEVSGVDLAEDLPEDVLGEVRGPLLGKSGDLLPQPEPDARAPTRVRPPLGRDPAAPLHGRHGRITPKCLGHHQDALARRRTSAVPGTPTRCSRRSPAMGTILYAVQVPSVGGDTMFTNHRTSPTNDCPDGMKALIKRPVKPSASETNSRRTAGKSRKESDDGPKERDAGERPRRRADHQHPPTDPHPSGNRAQGAVHRRPRANFDGMTDEESQPLMDFFMKQSTRPEHICRFRWKPDARIWDDPARSTTRSTTTRRKPGSCTASRSAATRRSEPRSKRTNKSPPSSCGRGLGEGSEPPQSRCDASPIPTHFLNGSRQLPLPTRLFQRQWRLSQPCDVTATFATFTQPAVPPPSPQTPRAA